MTTAEDYGAPPPAWIVAIALVIVAGIVALPALAALERAADRAGSIGLDESAWRCTKLRTRSSKTAAQKERDLRTNPPTPLECIEYRRRDFVPFN